MMLGVMELGCKMGKIPSTYQGLLLGAPCRFIVLSLKWRFLQKIVNMENTKYSLREETSVD